MISGTFLGYSAGFLLVAFFWYMAYGRDYAHEPLWFLVGVPGTVIALLSIGYFYYGMPIIDWAK
jgi:hypothetical protein